MKLRSAKLVVVLMTLAGLLFVAGIAAVLVLPTLVEVRRLSSEIVGAQTELEAQYANRRGLLSSIEEIRGVRRNVDRLAAQFVPEKQELSFITAAEAVAAKHGVEQRIRLSVMPEAALPELGRGFELVLTGSFRAVMGAILDLERLPNLLVFTSVGMNSVLGDAADKEATLSVTLRGAIAAPPKGL